MRVEQGVAWVDLDDGMFRTATPGECAARIAELEVGMRRAIHLAETLMPIVMWPDDNPDGVYGDEWAHITLDLVREALAE